MTPYTAQVIAPSEQDLLELARLMLELLPDIDLGRDEGRRQIVLSCHMLAKAVQELYPGMGRCVDGFFLSTWDHSWIETPKGNIIDLYPVGVLGGPLLVDRTIGYRMYTAHDHYSSLFKKESFLRSVVKIKEELEIRTRGLGSAAAILMKAT